MAETNKTEKATPKKRRDERKKGNAYQSKDVISIVVLIVGFVLISKLGGFVAGQVKLLYVKQMAMMEGLHEMTVATCMQVFREGVRLNCAAIAIAHNHPSGDPTPSSDDVSVTEQIVRAGKLLDIEVLDHLVIGRQRYVSLKERGLGFG